MVSQRGMTLVELLVALVVATIGLLGTLALLGTLFAGSTFSRSLTEATTLAQAKAEETVVAPLNPPDGTQPVESGLDGLGRAVLPPGPYTRTTTWSTVIDAAGARRHVEVVVSWIDGRSIAHQVTAQVERIP
jgi:prepilin-type N-terminal cleavage/methylation domain-containing protein